jgi:hypothetical protein
MQTSKKNNHAQEKSKEEETIVNNTRREERGACNFGNCATPFLFLFFMCVRVGREGRAR